MMTSADYREPARTENSPKEASCGLPSPAMPLADLKIPRPLQELEQIATERVEGIFNEMAKHLPDAIRAAPFPRVVFDPGAETSRFDPERDEIVIAGRHIDEGYAYAEEISHWIRWTLSQGVSRLPVPSLDPFDESMQRQNTVDEFFGFIGRAVGAEACRGTEWEDLFKAESAAFPASYEIVAGTARRDREIGYEGFPMLERFESIIGLAQAVLRKLEQHQWLHVADSQNGDEALVRSFCSAVADAGQEFRSALLGEEIRGLEIACKQLVESFEVLSAESEDLLGLTSRPDIILNARRTWLRRIGLAIGGAELEGMKVELLLYDAANAATDFTGHGAGYSSAALALESEASATDLFRRLVGMDSKKVFLSHILCDKYGDRKGFLERAGERLRHLFGRD